MNEQHPNEKAELVEGLGSNATQPQVDAPKPLVKKVEKKRGLQVKSQITGGCRIHLPS